MDSSEEYLYDDYYDYRDHHFFIPNKFCGDPLWVEEKFGNIFNNSSTSIPIFSWCFQHAILAELPVTFFLLSLPALLIQLKSGRAVGVSLPYDNLASMKHGLTCILVGDKLFILLLSFYEWFWLRESVPIVEFCYPFLQSMTLIGIFWASEKCQIKGLVCPGIIFCTWMLFVVTGLPEFYAWIKLGTDPQTVNEIDFYRYSAYLVWYPILCLLFILHFFSGSVPKRLSENESPEFYVSFINRQFFFWFNKLVSRGNKKPLTMRDIFTLDSSMFAANIFDRWNKAWQKRIKASSSPNERAFKELT